MHASTSIYLCAPRPCFTCRESASLRMVHCDSPGGIQISEAVLVAMPTHPRDRVEQCLPTPCCTRRGVFYDGADEAPPVNTKPECHRRSCPSETSDAFGERKTRGRRWRRGIRPAQRAPKSADGADEEKGRGRYRAGVVCRQTRRHGASLLEAPMVLWGVHEVGGAAGTQLQQASHRGTRLQERRNSNSRGQTLLPSPSHHPEVAKLSIERCRGMLGANFRREIDRKCQGTSLHQNKIAPQVAIESNES